jgi:hypothetical protein
MRSALIASFFKGITPLTSAPFCGAFGSAGADAYVQFPIFVKNAANVHLGDGVQIGYGVRMLLNRDQEVRIGDGSIVGSFVQFEPGGAITIGRNCIIARSTKVPAGTVIPDGTVFGAVGARRDMPHVLRPSARDTAITIITAIALICFAASASWIGWLVLGLAALLSDDDVVLPTLSIVLVLVYLATVGWGEGRTFAADNLVLCLISFVAVAALRAIAAAVRARRQSRNHPETIG